MDWTVNLAIGIPVAGLGIALLLAATTGPGEKGSGEFRLGAIGSVLIGIGVFFLVAGYIGRVESIGRGPGKPAVSIGSPSVDRTVSHA